MPTILFAGTSPSVLGDILDTCEELRIPCIDMIVPLVTGFHTHTHLCIQTQAQICWFINQAVLDVEGH